MPYRRMMLASALTVAAMAAAAEAALMRLPPGARLPTHWGIDGTPDAFGPAAVALFVPVAVTAVTALLLAVVPLIEPLQRDLDRSRGLYTSAWAGVLLAFAAIEAMLVAGVFGVATPATLPLAAIGILFLLLGNALPKSRPAFFVGIRTPWTLTDEDNWIATHRFGGRTMIAGGAAILLAALLPLPSGVRAATVTAAIILAVVPPILFSFVFWLRKRRHA